MSELSELLSKIGMNETELKVYETVVAFGFHTAGQVASKTGLGYQQSFDALNSLVEKNYLKVKEVKSKEGSIYYPMAPKIAISSDLSKSLSERLKSLSVKISEIWSNAESSIDNDTNQLINQIKTMLSEYVDKINQLSSNNQGSIETWYENTKYTLEETTNENVDEFKNEVISPLREISSSLSELSAQIKSKSSQSMGEINAKTDAHKESIEGAVESIKLELGEFADEVGFILSGRISGLNQLIENFSSSATERADGIISNMKSDYDSIKSAVSETFNTINSSFVDTSVELYNQKTSEVSEANNSFSSDFSGLIDTTLSSNNEIKEKTIAGSQQLLNEFNQKQIGSVENLHEQFNSTVNSVQENAVSQLSEILGATSAKLGELKIEIGSNLNQHQHDLGDQLKELTSNVENNFNERFEEIKVLLSEFVDNLKTSTQNNVDQSSQSIHELKSFLQNFLSDVQADLDQQLQTLSTDVGNSLSGIVQGSSESIDSSSSQNKEQLSSINTDLNGKLSTFQTSIDEFLRAAKSDLQSRLTESQEVFRGGVDAGVAVYKAESQRITDIQTDQLNDIKEETEQLSKEASKSKNDALNAVNNGLTEIKKNALKELEERISGDVDKISREISRFNERLDRELNRFYEDFQDKTVSLRDDVPQSIENMFLGQTDKLEGIRRVFDSNRRFITDFFDKVENEMQPGEKNWKKKEFQTEFYELAQRIRGDFARFESEIQNYFSFALEDTEEVKNEVLSGFNRTIEDEVSALESLVSDRTSRAKSISSEFKESLGGNTDQLSSDMAASINDTISDLTSNIQKTLLTKFEQPLEAILGKAQALATGTEGVDQENRIIKAQNLLISVIDSAVEQLAISLQQAFEDSVEDLDTKVESTIAESTEIVNGLQNNISSAFDNQNQTIENFANSVKSELSTVQQSVNDQLSSTIDKTKSNVSETFDNKNQEVENTVYSKTQELQDATNSKLTEVDQSLESFKSNLDVVKSETLSSVNSMVDSSIESQKQALEQTLANLNSATDEAKNVIGQTQSSLDTNVGETLSKLQEDINQLVTNYNQGLDDVKAELSKKITEFYTVDSKNGEIEALKAKMSQSVESYLSTIQGIQTNLKEGLETRVDDLKTSHSDHLDQYSTQLMQKIDALAESNSTFIFDLFDQISTQLSSVQAEVLGSVENAKNNIDLTVTNSVETVRTDILNPANEVVNAVNQSTVEYADKISELTNNFDTMADQEDSVIETARGKILEKLGTSIEREKNSWQERGQSLYGDQSSTLETMASEFESKVNSATSQGKEAVSAEIEKIPDVVEDTLEAAARSMELLNEISKGSIELDPDTPDTSYFDANKEAIIANLNAILERTKSSVTIVSPNISWLDPNIISGFTRATVRIIIDPDKLSFDDQEIIDKFKEHNVSVSLRKLDRNRYRRDLDMIMATRDREEVMISKLLTTDKPYAFVSQDEYFIDKFAELFGIFQTMPEYKP